MNTMTGGYLLTRTSQWVMVLNKEGFYPSNFLRLYELSDCTATQKKPTGCNFGTTVVNHLIYADD